MRWVHLSIIVLFAAVIVIFAAQNLQLVQLVFLGASFHMRLAFLIVVVYVLGAFTGGSLWSLLRRSFERARIVH